MILSEIAQYYNSKKSTSIREIAQHFHISEAKTLKCLITSGIYPTDTAKQIKVLRDQERTESEIAEQLHISLKSMSKYTPYTKCIYDDNPSRNAEAIKKCREKICK